jgi:hypothetical protein
MLPLNICAIVKDEAKYLEEWIEYHLLQGVSHFTIYDNDSNDSTTDILESYAKLGIVTRIPWEGRQLEAYNRYISEHKLSSDWTAFIDVDEFLYSSQGTSTFQEVLHSFEGFAGLIVNWMFFGTSGFKKYDKNKLVIERFTLRDKALNEHYKMIVKPCHVSSAPLNPHHFNMRMPTVIDSKGKIVPINSLNGTYKPDQSCPLRINHYHTKSEEEYKIKCARPRADNGETRDFDTNFGVHDVNHIEDLGMNKWVADVKKNIEKRPWNQK